MVFLIHMAAFKGKQREEANGNLTIKESEVNTWSWLFQSFTCFFFSICLSVQKRRGSMYLEEETGKKSEVISCIFSLKEEVGALAKALRLFEVNLLTPNDQDKES